VADIISDKENEVDGMLDLHDPVFAPSTYIFVLSRYANSHCIEARCIRVCNLVNLWGCHLWALTLVTVVYSEVVAESYYLMYCQYVEAV